MILRRNRHNPIVTRDDIPNLSPHVGDPSSVFNPGAVMHRGKFILVLRVQSRGRRTFLLVARSWDGEHFDIDEKLVEIPGLDSLQVPVHHVYDPRITRLDDAYFITLALDTDDVCLMGIARTADFESFEWIGVTSDENTRNAVLFPEKIGGRYGRFDRPNLLSADAGNPPTGDRILFSTSEDLIEWRAEGEVVRGRPHLWDERIGAGPPPVKTRDGWLLVYHGVATHFGSANIYQAGVLLTALDEPGRLIARSTDNVLEPREPYELTGQVPNVVFPTGMIVEDVDDAGFAAPESRVFLYYGAADTCVGLATTTVAELIEACDEKGH